jgi:peptidoglycan-N-acetylglucosamine deacetylase
MASQIFHTPNTKRWKNFKWTARVFALIFVFFLTVLAFALIRGSKPGVPNLEAPSRAYENPLQLSHTKSLKYKGFKDFLLKKQKEESADTTKKRVKTFFTDTLKQTDIPYIRAAFYTPWTSGTSLPSLKQYGNNLNAIFPEWFFVDSNNTSHLQTRIDKVGFEEMKSKGLLIIPILGNFLTSQHDFKGELIHDILTNPAKRSVFINQLVDTLTFYHLQGVNIDFENMIEETNDPLTSFQRDLYNALHPKGLFVTMDVSPKNDDYDYKRLADYNDYIILMAYDQHTRHTKPGPISESKWIEDALDWTASRISSEKIILGIAAYGRDWETDATGKTTAKDITYSDAINRAKIVGAKVFYDNHSYNLHYNYSVDAPKENEGIINHEVWFTDAATLFNILRFSDEYSTAGTILWRLGGEDARLWDFYGKDLSNDALETKPFDFSQLEYVPVTPNSVGYIDSSGEVLDIISKPSAGKIKLEVDTTEMLIAEQDYIQLPSGYLINKFGEDTTEGPGHKIILTFDDGPDPIYTPKILSILEREKVPATFFIVGLNAEKNIPIFQREIRDGFEIGNHTFTHNNIAKMSEDRADVEMKLTRLLIESVSGRSTILFRAPFNADSQPQTYEELEPIARSRTQNYITVNESIDPNDWQPGVSADSIVARVIHQIEERNASIILLHDAGGETRQATVDALPGIIAYCKSKGYVFTTVADLIGKKKDDVMPVVPAGRQSWISKFDFYLAEFTYWASHIIFSLFIIGIILSLARTIAMGIMASLKKVTEKNSTFVNNTHTVSIIIPAYNEEVNVIRTIHSLLLQDYPSVEVIFVDDGSTDNTYQRVVEEFITHSNVHVFTKPNGGKATALNYGIEHAGGEYVVCIDADTQLKTDAVTELMKMFTSEKIGAVAGNVKVGNEINLITKWQSIEYITQQNYDRRAFDLINCITVIPGAIGAFKKTAVIEAGGFTMDTLAEDCDLTMRLHRCGYIIRNCTTAISYTEAPETIRQFLKQRFRWSFGVMQSFWKHRDTLFNPKYKNFGMVAMPNILVYQLLLPILSPLADLVLLISLVAASMDIILASPSDVAFYYLIFTVVDSIGAAVAFSFEKTSYVKLLWLIPQRLIYRQLMYYILFKSFGKALKGERQGWGVLKRTGSVKTITAQPSNKVN